MGAERGSSRNRIIAVGKNALPETAGREDRRHGM